VRKYQRGAGNELDTFLLRSSLVKYQPDLFKDIRDQEGNLIDPKDFKRSNELTGAGIEYATSLVEYLCTHYKDMIQDTGSALYYETKPIQWQAALEIMSGGVKGQRGRVERALLMLHAKPKPVVIQRKDGRLTSMQPFVLAFDWGQAETLDARAAQKLAQCQRGTDVLAQKREGEAPDLLPIESISVQFAKPLFEDLLRKGGNTYSFPTGMYAKMYRTAEGLNAAEEKRDCLAYDPHTSAFARFVRYIFRHNNLTAKQMKDKRHHSPLHLNLLDMTSEVYPSAVSINGRGERHVEMKKIRDFIDRTMDIYFRIDNFLFYPVVRSLSAETLSLELYTDIGEARKEREAAEVPPLPLPAVSRRRGGKMSPNI